MLQAPPPPGGDKTPQPYHCRVFNFSRICLAASSQATTSSRAQRKCFKARLSQLTMLDLVACLVSLALRQPLNAMHCAVPSHHLLHILVANSTDTHGLDLLDET
jgi:hypothetical protein